MTQESLRPFMPSRPSGPVFIGLNVLRVLSILALILVVAANAVTMSDDIKAIKASDKDQAYECDVVEYSTVPDQAGGAFWSILNRLFILFECILLILSEVGFPRKLFEGYVPILGPAHGLGALGVFQALIGAQVLSHPCDAFPQVASWLLFIIGGFNVIAGIVLQSKAKPKRLVFSWENVSSLTPQTRMAATAWDMVSEKRRATPASQAPLSRQASQHSDTPLLPDHAAPGAKFGGFGFGRQGEKAAAARGWKISRPVESLPRYAV